MNEDEIDPVEPEEEVEHNSQYDDLRYKLVTAYDEPTEDNFKAAYQELKTMFEADAAQMQTSLFPSRAMVDAVSLLMEHLNTALEKEPNPDSPNSAMLGDFKNALADIENFLGPILVKLEK